MQTAAAPAKKNTLPIRTINDVLDSATVGVAQAVVAQVITDAIPPAELKINTQMSCAACGSTEAVTHNHGDVCFYSGWRIQRRRSKCSKCGQLRFGPDSCVREDAPVKEDFSNVRQTAANQTQADDVARRRAAMLRQV